MGPVPRGIAGVFEAGFPLGPGVLPVSPVLPGLALDPRGSGADAGEDGASPC
jgi:hypothetical protein